MAGGLKELNKLEVLKRLTVRRTRLHTFEVMGGAEVGPHRDFIVEMGQLQVELDKERWDEVIKLTKMVEERRH